MQVFGFHSDTRQARLKAVLFAAVLLLGFLADQSAQAQFGSGRSRDSIFSRRSNRPRGSDSGPPPSAPPPVYEQQNQAPAQEQAQETTPPAPPPPQQPETSPAAQTPSVPVPVPGQVPVRPLPPGKKPVKGQVKGQVKGPPAKEQPKGGIAPEGQVVLRLVPLDQKADVNQEFAVHVWLDNPAAKPFDVVSFALSYDPRLLELIDAPGGMEGVPNVFDQSEKIKTTLPLVRDPRIDPFYLNRTDTENGMIYYRARSASGESTINQGFLASMKFKALAPVEHTGLKFMFSDWTEGLAPPVQSDQSWSWPATMTFVGSSPSPEKKREGWVNLLGSERNDKDGVVSGNVTLKGDYDKALEQAAADAPKGETRTRLFFSPGVTAVQAGMTTDINVELSNPDGVPWDRVRLDIEYDPDYLDVIDQDSGNWITRGTNILDGPFHTRFPFDWMRNNLVRQRDGRILYECGVFKTPLRVGGTLATIRFRAVRSIPETRVVFRLPSEVTASSGTILVLRRGDVLASTDNPRDGVAGAVLMIVPSREDQEVVGKQAKGRDR